MLCIILVYVIEMVFTLERCLNSQRCLLHTFTSIKLFAAYSCRVGEIKEAWRFNLVPFYSSIGEEERRRGGEEERRGGGEEERRGEERRGEERRKRKGQRLVKNLERGGEGKGEGGEGREGGEGGEGRGVRVRDQEKVQKAWERPNNLFIASSYLYLAVAG